MSINTMAMKTNKSLFYRSILAGLLYILPTYAHSGDTTPSSATMIVSDKDVLSYLQDVISWRHAIVDSDLSPDNARVAVLKDVLRQNSQKVLRSCFEFAHAESAALENAQETAVGKSAPDNTHHATLAKRIDDTNQHLEQMQEQLDALSKDAANVTEREKLEGEIKVEKAHLDLLNNFMNIFSADDNGDKGLSGEINKLSYSILGDLNEESVAPKVDNKEAAISQDDGIIAITSDMIAISKKKHTIDALIEQTDALTAENQKILKALRAPMQDAIKEGNALADAEVNADKKSIEEHRKALDVWLSGYKKLSAVALPLGKITALLDTSSGNLKEWNIIIGQEWNKVFRHFVIRMAILCASLIIPFVLMELAHKAILRYVKDIQRLRQLNIVRQMVFVTLLITVFCLNFFTEFGSLATYAGFLTAGLAVALQTVLVSLTAHFFFFGRFGVRAGDRVTISGVTGDVVQVGMLRLYLMELIGDKAALRPSGKIVAFPNSVLFNATAFSKQVPGTSYTWNDLTFLLDPDSDFSLANKKILEVVNSVYEEYKKVIDRQYISLEQSTNLSVGLPTPRSEVRIKDIGLTCEVHYPVTMERVTQVYEQIIQKLIKAFESDKDFRLVLSNPLKVVARNKQ